MYKTRNSNAGWSLLFVAIPTQPHPISQPHSSALSCFVSHKVLTMDGILVPCVFWLLASSRYWQEVGGKERDGKVTVFVPSLSLSAGPHVSEWVCRYTYATLLCNCPSGQYCSFLLYFQNWGDNSYYLLVCLGVSICVTSLNYSTIFTLLHII